MPPDASPRTFMLVHGAWHGAWVWQAVATVLRAKGHRVYTPTLTGLGERAGQLDRSITLRTFVNDIEQAILSPATAASLRSCGTPEVNAASALDEVILVGHSFAGLVITGVADRLPGHLAQLVYLDAFLLPSGQSTFDTLPVKTVEAMLAAAETTGGAGMPPPDPKHLGIAPGTTEYEYARQRLTPHPIGTYGSPLHLQAAIGNGIPKHYIHCSSPAYKPVAAAYEWALAQQGWQFSELAASHSAPLLAPDALGERLLQIAAS